jgi:hypothetical protein
MRPEPQIAQMTETGNLFDNHRTISSESKSSLKQILRPLPQIREICAICGYPLRISSSISL